MPQATLLAHREASVNKLTARQANVLRTVENYIRREGIAPTFQELGDLLEMTPASARQHVLAIENKGYLRRHPGKSRGLVIVESDRAPGRKR